MIVGSPTILNLVPGGVNKVVHVNQVNDNIEIQFQIMNGSQPYNVTEGVSCTIRGTKGDSYGYTAEAATTVGSNVVTVTLTEQLTAVAGGCNVFELVFVGAENSMKVSTENFILAVERAALGEDTVISDSDLAYAEQVLDQLQSVGAVNAQVQQNKANLAAEISRAQAAEAAEAAARQAADNTLQSNINAEASTRATQDASLQSQINQLIAPSGSAPSAAEVENARVGADGTVYPTLGDAIRTQDAQLKSAITDINESTGVTFYPFTSGYIAVNASPVNISRVYANDAQMHTVVECAAGDEFYLMGVGTSSTAGLWTFIDSNGARLLWKGKITYSDYTKITAPANAAYLVVNIETAEDYGLYSGQMIKDRVGALETTIVQKQDILAFDSTPIKNSNNPVTSGGLYEKFVTTPTMEVGGYGSNLFDKTNAGNADGKIINIATGDLYNNASYFTTYFIPVVAGRTYSFLNGTTTSVRAYLFFDENKDILQDSGGEQKTGGIKAPENAAYIRASLVGSTAAGSTWQFLWGTYQEPYSDYVEKYSLNRDVLPILVKCSKTRNQYDPSAAVHASINPDDGSLTYAGPSNTLFTTGLIYCEGCSYVVSALPVSMISASPTNMTLRSIAFYDADMDLLQYTDNATGDYVYNVNDYAYTRVAIPSGAVYLRIRYNYDITQNIPLMIECVHGENAFPLTPYIAYSEGYALRNEYKTNISYTDSFFSGKTINVIGDSITYGYGTFTTLQKAFPQLVGYRLNMAANNYGINSSEIAERSAGDLTHDPMCIRYADMTNDADVIVVAGGTNDWGHSDVTLGEMGDTSTNTFYGALDTMCKGLLAKYPGKYIVFMTPIKRMAAGFAYYEPNGLGYTLKQFADAIKEVCAFYGIPVLDMFEKCQLNPLITEIQSVYFVDGTHPTQAGQIYISSMVAGFIASLAD